MTPKRFPQIVHAFYEPNGGENEYLCVTPSGLDVLEAGQRCAIYKLVQVGTVHGPKSFVPNKRKGVK